MFYYQKRQDDYIIEIFFWNNFSDFRITHNNTPKSNTKTESLWKKDLALWNEIEKNKYPIFPNFDIEQATLT